MQCQSAPAAVNSIPSPNYADYVHISVDGLHPESQLKLALELSEKETKLAEQRQQEEDKLMEEVLKLSLQEK